MPIKHLSTPLLVGFLLALHATRATAQAARHDVPGYVVRATLRVPRFVTDPLVWAARF